MHLRFQYMKNLDMQREKYNGLERENINLVRKLDELAMMNGKPALI